MGICKYCFSKLARPCFVLPENCGYDAYLEEDATLRNTLTNYDVTCSAKRLVISPEAIRWKDETLWEQQGYLDGKTAERNIEDYILLRSATENDLQNHAATINGKTALIRPVDNAHQPLLITQLACSECHTILPYRTFSDDDTEIPEITKKVFRVVLVANTSAGKTNLTAAMYQQFMNGSAGVSLQISEPLFAGYHRDTANNLNYHGIVPPSTQHSTPPLSVTYEKQGGGQVAIDVVDTKGEITSVVDLEPCIRADLIILLIDIRAHDSASGDGTQSASGDGTQSADYITDIEKLATYVYKLSQYTDFKKRIIVAFSKCDLYEQTAKKYMLHNNLINASDKYRHANLRNLRNYLFSNDMQSFMNEVCAEINQKCEASQQISENSQMVVSKIMTELLASCNNISSYQTDIMCVAPLGTGTLQDADGTDRVEQNKLNPRYITELIELIKLYGGEAR
ncbi:MAG: hypothetical protein MJ071_02090 [Oscillospiraceae bacterium]|nr:hypothetical protein [Oscillospiraceae bacterium]